MKELQKQSANWGAAALTLGIVALILTLPHWPVKSNKETTRNALTASPEANIWIGYFGQCALRAGIILFVTFALAVLPVLVG